MIDINDDLVDEYLKGIKEYMYNGKMLEFDKKFVSQINKTILNYLLLAHDNIDKKSLSEIFNSIYRKVHMSDFYRNGMRHDELRIDFFYELFLRTPELKSDTTFEDINNFIFSLFKNGYIGYRVKSNEISFDNFFKGKDYYNPNTHIFNKNDTIYITVNGVEYYKKLNIKNVKNNHILIEDNLIKLNEHINYDINREFFIYKGEYYYPNKKTKPFLMIKLLISKIGNVVSAEEITDYLELNLKKRKTGGKYSCEQIYFIFKNIKKTTNLKFIEDLVLEKNGGYIIYGCEN